MLALMSSIFTPIAKTLQLFAYDTKEVFDSESGSDADRIPTCGTPIFILL